MSESRRHDRERPPDPYDETDLRQPSAIDPRDEVIGLSGITALAGLWLLVSPVLLGYSRDDPVLVDAVSGALVMSFALIRVGGAFRSVWPSLINVVLGAWVFTGIWRADTATAAMNDLIVGALVLLFATSSAASTLHARRRAERRARRESFEGDVDELPDGERDGRFIGRAPDR